jgi:hypothetical protein
MVELFHYVFQFLLYDIGGDMERADLNMTCSPQQDWHEILELYFQDTSLRKVAGERL